MKQIFKSKVVLLLVLIIIFLVGFKFFINKDTTDNNQTDFKELDKPNNKITTIIPTPIIINGLTPEEINSLKGEEYDIFVDSLNEEQWNYLIPLKYDFDLPYEEESFWVEKYENNNLTVRSKINDINKAKDDLYGWLYFEKGQDPKNINIIWNE